MRLPIQLMTLLAAVFHCSGVIFTFEQHGDIHSEAANKFQTTATNIVPWMLSHTNDGTLNIVGHINAGDCFESTVPWVTTNTGIVNEKYHGFLMTNDMNTMRTNGLLVFIAPGNHDADNTNNLPGYCTWPVVNLWNDIFPPSLFTNQPYYVTSRFAGDNKQMVMKYTNDNVKLLFVDYTPEADTNNYLATYSAQSAWVSNQIASYPDHNAIVVSHYLLNTNGVPSPEPGVSSGYFTIGPGDAPILHGLLNLPNLFLFISGHNLAYLKGCYRTNGADGHPVYFTCFNTQAMNEGQVYDFANLFTFDTVRSTMRNRTYWIPQGKFLEDYNGVMDRFGTVLMPNGAEHNPPELPLPIRPAVRLIRR